MAPSMVLQQRGNLPGKPSWCQPSIHNIVYGVPYIGLWHFVNKWHYGSLWPCLMNFVMFRGRIVRFIFGYGYGYVPVDFNSFVVNVTFTRLLHRNDNA